MVTRVLFFVLALALRASSTCPLGKLRISIYCSQTVRTERSACLCSEDGARRVDRLSRVELVRLVHTLRRSTCAAVNDPKQAMRDHAHPFA